MTAQCNQYILQSPSSPTPAPACLSRLNVPPPPRSTPSPRAHRLRFHQRPHPFTISNTRASAPGESPQPADPRARRLIWPGPRTRPLAYLTRPPPPFSPPPALGLPRGKPPPPLTSLLFLLPARVPAPCVYRPESTRQPSCISPPERSPPHLGRPVSLLPTFARPAPHQHQGRTPAPAPAPHLGLRSPPPLTPPDTHLPSIHSYARLFICPRPCCPGTRPLAGRGAPPAPGRPTSCRRSPSYPGVNQKPAARARRILFSYPRVNLTRPRRPTTPDVGPCCLGPRAFAGAPGTVPPEHQRGDPTPPRPSSSCPTT